MALYSIIFVPWTKLAYAKDLGSKFKSSKGIFAAETHGVIYSQTKSKAWKHRLLPKAYTWLEILRKQKSLRHSFISSTSCVALARAPSMKQTSQMRYEFKSVKKQFYMKYYPWEKETETKEELHVTDVSHASYCIATMRTSMRWWVQEMGSNRKKFHCP